MELLQLTPETWMKERKRALNFAIRFGEKRITVSSLHALRGLDPNSLQQDGDGHSKASIVIAKQGGRMTGLGYAADGGDGGCFLVVHPSVRRLGTGSTIMKAIMNRIGYLSCDVASDNVPSMALCFALGMKAVSIHRGPTGKSTLRFERGIQHDPAHPGHIDSVSQ